MSTKIQVRRGTAAQWTAANPTLDAGEIGLETDTGKVKIGNVRNITQTVVTGGTNVVYTTGVAHGLVALDYVNITGITTAQGQPASNPVQITAVTSTTFTVNVTTGTTGTYTSLSGNATSPWNSSLYLTDHSDFVGVLTGFHGGTGVANTGKTITVSGDTAIGSSTDTVTLTTSGNTSVALPTSGTLATRTGAEQLTSKTFGSNSYSTTQSLSVANDLVFLTASAGWTLSLPSPTAGKILHITRTDATAFIITVLGHINGTASTSNVTWFPASTANRRVILISNGTTWYPMVAGTVV
jgi:hypothetical protein